MTIHLIFDHDLEMYLNMPKDTCAVDSRRPMHDLNNHLSAGLATRVPLILSSLCNVRAKNCFTFIFMSADTIIRICQVLESRWKMLSSWWVPSTSSSSIIHPERRHPQEARHWLQRQPPARGGKEAIGAASARLMAHPHARETMHRWGVKLSTLALWEVAKRSSVLLFST